MDILLNWLTTISGVFSGMKALTDMRKSGNKNSAISRLVQLYIMLGEFESTLTNLHNYSMAYPKLVFTRMPWSAQGDIEEFIRKLSSIIKDFSTIIDRDEEIFHTFSIYDQELYKLIYSTKHAEDVFGEVLQAFIFPDQTLPIKGKDLAKNINRVSEKISNLREVLRQFIVTNFSLDEVIDAM